MQHLGHVLTKSISLHHLVLSAAGHVSTIIVYGVVSMDKPSGAVPEQVRMFAPKPKRLKDDPTAETERLLIAVLHAAGVSNKKHERATQLVNQPSVPCASSQGPEPRKN